MILEPAMTEEVTTDATNNNKEFRRHCRQFYLRSTCVVSESSSDGDADAGEIPMNHTGLVVEAMDRLLLEQSYRSCNDGNNPNNKGFNPAARSTSSQAQPSPYEAFLSSQPAESVRVLESCGLPARDEEIGRTASNPDLVSSFATARAEERRAAHEAQMAERAKGTLCLLREMSDDGCEKSALRNARLIRRTIQSFVGKYCEQSIASHPLLAGMRKAIEMQLGDRGAVTKCAVVWTFDAAAISEAVQTKACGAGGDDAYIRDALEAVLSLLVWIRNGVGITEGKKEKDAEGRGTPTGTTGSATTLLTFQVHPSLSDRSLERILEILPRPDRLHGRATGTILVGNTARTNIAGEMDEADFCTQIMREAFGGFFYRLRLY